MAARLIQRGARRLLGFAALLATALCAADAPLVEPAVKRAVGDDARVVTRTAFTLADPLAILCGVPIYQEPSTGQTLPLVNPHAKYSARVFANSIAEPLLLKGVQEMPVGSVIVKAKYSDASATKIELMTVMTKRAAGFNPDHGDWEYAVADAQGIIAKQGKLASCMSCHDEYLGTDRLSRVYLQSKEYAKAANEEALAEGAEAKKSWAYRLGAFGEKELSMLDRSVPMIRFLWIRTFHNPVMIRVWLEKNEAKLRVVRMSGKGGYDWARIESDKTRILPKMDWLDLLDMSRDPDAVRPLRNLPIKNRDPIFGTDGSAWIIETVRDGRLSFAQIWTPSAWKDSTTIDALAGKKVSVKPCEGLGLRLIELSGLKGEPIY